MIVTWNAVLPPDDPDHIDATEAAELYSRATRQDEDTSPDTFRKWLRDRDEHVRGFVFGKWGMWWVSRNSMLDVFEAQAQHLLRVVNEAREVDQVGEGK